MEQEIKAGRELDALIAEKVFGWTAERRSDASMREVSLLAPGIAGKPWRFTQYLNESGTSRELGDFGPPHYSTDIAAAWEVVARMKGYLVLKQTGYRVPDFWSAEFVGYRDSLVIGEASAPLAICKAALKAVAALKDSEL